MKKLIAIFLLSLSWNLNAQDYGSYPKIEQDKLIRDLDLLYQGLNKFHSGLYWYTPQDSFEQAFIAAQNAIDEDLNILEFYKIIAPFVALSREDHTDLALPESTMNKIRSEASFLPLVVIFLGDDLYCLRNGSNQDLDIVGKKILSINGLSPNEIVDKIGQFFASDGYIEEVKKKDLGEFKFSRFYYHYFGNLPSYSVEFEDASVELRSLTIKEINKNIAQRNYQVSSLGIYEDCLEFEIIADSIAYLAVHDFDNDAMKENRIHKNYSEFLSSSFGQIDEQILSISYLISQIMAEDQKETRINCIPT